jgi:flagellar biosynthesis/type III secretory pathway M-ring protein FliF/YscJ
MDWQQLQSLYTQKQSVERTGTLTPETISPKNSSKTPVHRRPPVWILWLILIGLIVIVAIFIWYKKFSPRSGQAPTANTTEITQEELRQQMIDEIVQANKENPIDPQAMHEILSGAR